MLWVTLLQPNPFPAAILCFNMIIKLSSGLKIGGGGVCIYTKDKRHLNDIFENRFEVHWIYTGDEILRKNDR
jgi:hypothetical protein